MGIESVTNSCFPCCTGFFILHRTCPPWKLTTGVTLKASDRNLVASRLKQHWSSSPGQSDYKLWSTVSLCFSAAPTNLQSFQCSSRTPSTIKLETIILLETIFSAYHLEWMDLTQSMNIPKWVTNNSFAGTKQATNYLQSSSIEKILGTTSGLNDFCLEKLHPFLCHVPGAPTCAMARREKTVPWSWVVA